MPPTELPHNILRRLDLQVLTTHSALRRRYSVSVVIPALVLFVGTFLYTPVRRVRNFDYHHELPDRDRDRYERALPYSLVYVIRESRPVDTRWIDRWRWSWRRYRFERRHRETSSEAVVPESGVAVAQDAIVWPIVFVEQAVIVLGLGGALTWLARRHHRRDRW